MSLEPLLLKYLPVIIGVLVNNFLMDRIDKEEHKQNLSIIFAISIIVFLLGLLIQKNFIFMSVIYIFIFYLLYYIVYLIFNKINKKK